jgi:hypothetical protein
LVRKELPIAALVKIAGTSHCPLPFLHTMIRKQKGCPSYSIIEMAS